MDQQSQISFIPKTVLTRSTENIPHTVNLGMVIVVVVLILSLGLWGGAYAYKRILDNEINAPCQDTSVVGGQTQTCGLRASIIRARQDLDQTTTIYLKRLSDKLAIGQELVSSHKTVVPIFRLLEELTLPTIYFTRFDFKGNTATFDGRAATYEDVAVETQVLARDQGRVKSFLFSDIDLDGLGNVIFKLVLNIEPEVTSYAKALAANPTTP